MLKHEPEPMPPTPTAPIPAAERRVSAEELTRAVSALEDAKAAERVAGVAPIGQVVDELGLDSTPEEIWAEVEKQRAEAAAPKPQVQAVPAVQTQQIARQVRRGWRGMRGWAWVIFWCTGGFGLLAGLPQLLMHSQAPTATSAQTLTINGDFVEQTINAQGKDVIINGDIDNITLRGVARSVKVNGDFDNVTGETPQRYIVAGKKWNGLTSPTGP